MFVRIFFFVFILFAALTAFMPSAQAYSLPRACTQEHLLRAMKLNRERQPLYARITANQSLPVSKALLQFEDELLTEAPLADIASLIYQLAGVPLLCREYVSMDLVPAFRSHSPLPVPNLKDFRAVDIQRLSQELKTATTQENFPQIVLITRNWLAALSTQPQFHCLTRHFIESIGRAAALAPEQNALAKHRLHIPSLAISKAFIKGHLSKLKRTESIDELAAPIQSQGVPIICQDIPPIAIPN